MGARATKGKPTASDRPADASSIDDVVAEELASDEPPLIDEAFADLDDGEGARRPFALQFVERFGDFFEFGLLASVSLGFLLTWVWMGLVEGYPVFMDGQVDLTSVLLLLGSFVAVLLLMGFVKQLRVLVAKPRCWVAAAVLMALSAAAMLVMFFLGDQAPRALALSVVRCLMVVLGAGTGLQVACCAVAWCCMKPPSAAVAFAAGSGFMFVSYFCINSCEQHVSGMLFCLLPLAVTGFLLKDRRVIVERVRTCPPKEAKFARGFVSMCLSFGVFFFAIGTKCAFEPPAEFAEGAATSVIGLLLASLLLLYLVALRRSPMGVLRVLGVFYGAAVMVLTACIALAPLSLDPAASIIYNADVLLVMMVFWLLTVFVAYLNEMQVLKVVGVAFASAAIGMAAGWTFGVVVHFILAHDRSYFAIAIACATAAFSTVGFSSKSFPSLTRRGEEAKKMQRNAITYTPVDYGQKMADDYGLSEREAEVLRLLVAGYGADAVAEKLVISYHTARTHVRNIYKKMDVHSQRELLDRFDAVKQG